MLHFENLMLKTFYIIRGVRRTISSTEKFSGRVTVKSKPDGITFRRFKGVGTRASYIAAYVDTTASFRLNMRIEKEGGNGVRAAVSSLRQLDLGEEKKMRFTGGEVVFHRLKIRSKTANVADINVERVRGGINTLAVAIERVSVLGTFLVPSPDRDSEAACVFTILIYFRN